MTSQDTAKPINMKKVCVFTRLPYIHYLINKGVFPMTTISTDKAINFKCEVAVSDIRHNRHVQQHEKFEKSSTLCKCAPQ